MAFNLVARATAGTIPVTPVTADGLKEWAVDADTATKTWIAATGYKAKAGETIAGRAIKDVVTVNGARVILDNGGWGLVRASSNTPNLVVVCESPDSEEELRAIFADIDAVIRTEPNVGEYDQTF